MRLISLRFVGFFFLLFTLVDAQNVKITELTVKSGDVDLYVRVAGDLNADNVLLAIHGGPGGSCDYMLNLEQYCSEKWAVVNFDQRGAGKSSKSSEGCSLDTFASDIEAIRKELGVDKVNLFGHSWGGMIALYYVASYPESVNRIILMGGAPTNAQVLNQAEEMLVKKAESLIEKKIIPAELPKDPVEMLKAIMPVYFSDPEYNAPYEVKNLYFDPVVSKQIMADIGEWNFDEKAAGLKKKVLIIWGKDDPFGIKMGEYNKNVLTSADVKFVLLDKCGHYWHEREEETIKLMNEFLEN